MSKAKIIDKKSVDSILGEKNLLSELHHPFIVNMVYSFQDHDYLYLIMDLLPGGNLRYHLGIKRHFNEKQNKFLIGCILVGLEYIHGENILHRDIKPENLVFDENGYLRITDFGIAKKYTVNNKKDTSGTVGYLAPEVLCNENHNFSIDYYAVGIITYELAYGHRPYIGKTKHEVKQLILTRQAHVEYDDLPDGYQNEAADFINKLIQRKPKNRLGKDSINQVINHPWLKGFDWESMKKKTLKAHYIPKDGDNFDKKYCLQNNKMGTETIERYKKITNETEIDDDLLNSPDNYYNDNEKPRRIRGRKKDENIPNSIENYELYLKGSPKDTKEFEKENKDEINYEPKDRKFSDLDINKCEDQIFSKKEREPYENTQNEPIKLVGKEREPYENTQNEPIMLDAKEREPYENTQNEPIMLNAKEKEPFENIKNDEFGFNGKEREPFENIKLIILIILFYLSHIH